MKTHITLAALALTAWPVFAMGQSGTAEIDTNEDGVLTIDEVQAVFPEVSTDAFLAMDLDADGALNADEVAAAQEAGMMPQPEG